MPVLKLQDGAALPYAEKGVGLPIVLVHGWAAHGGFFDDLAARLSRRHRVIIPTLRGHPGFQAGSKPLSIETLGEDIAALFEALDLRETVALGWSMGAMALWSAHAKLAPRLSGLIVEEMSPRLVNDEDWRSALGGSYAPADVAATLDEINGDWSAYVARFTPRLFARGAADDLIAWTTQEMSKAEPAPMAALWASMAAQDFRRALRAIQTPTLVLRGAESAVHPAGAIEFVARAVPSGAHVVIPGAGHVPHLEAPDLFFETVSAFARDARRRDAYREEVKP